MAWRVRREKEEVVVTLGRPMQENDANIVDQSLCRTAPGFGRAAVGVVVREYRSVETNLTTAPVNATGIYSFVKLRVTGMDKPSGTTRGGVVRTIFGQGFPKMER